MHVDILREEQGEYVLCKDIGKSSDEKSKIDWKEKRDVHDSINEKDGHEVEGEKQECSGEVIFYSNILSYFLF